MAHLYSQALSLRSCHLAGHRRKKVLQGLALGKFSNARTHLTINWVERSFEPTYLRAGILPIVLDCASVYADLVGAERVLIKDPVDPAVYMKYGFAPFKPKKRVHGTYLSKELSHG
jgi:hypothetical protein